VTKDTTKTAAVAADLMLFDDWFDPIENGVRARVRGFIETMLEEELDSALSRPRYGRRKASQNEEAAAPIVGCRHGHRKRGLTGTFGKTEIAVPRARIEGESGKTSEWKSKSLPAYQRRTKAADALIAGAYLVCRACSTAWRWKSSAQPDDGEGLAKRKGVAARRGLKEARSKTATR